MAKIDNKPDPAKVEIHLNKACAKEIEMVNADADKKDGLRKQANIYFRSAMKNDGNPNYGQDVLASPQ